MDLDVFWRWSRDFHLPAVGAALISVAYFRSSATTQSFARRVLASAYGIVIALFYLGAWMVYLTHHANDIWARPFTILMVIPLGLIAISFVAFRGRMMVHLLQLPLLLCLLWVWLRGTVIITGFLF